MTNLDDLEAKARAATPEVCALAVQRIFNSNAEWMAGADCTEIMRQFHAALNPTVALALIQVAKAAQAMATDCGLKEPIPGTSYWSYAPSLVKPIPLGQALQALTRAMEGMK